MDQLIQLTHTTISLQVQLKKVRAKIPGSGPIPKIATKIAANNKSGIVRIKFKIIRARLYKNVLVNTLLAQTVQVE